MCGVTDKQRNKELCVTTNNTQIICTTDGQAEKTTTSNLPWEITDSGNLLLDGNEYIFYTNISQ